MEAEVFPHLLREKVCLVIAPLSLAASAQRHWNDYSGRKVPVARRQRHSDTQNFGKSTEVAELELMDQRAHVALVAEGGTKGGERQWVGVASRTKPTTPGKPASGA